MNLNMCELPFEIDVEIKSFQNIAFRLGIIKANICNYDLWLSNRMINCVHYIGQEYNVYDKDPWGYKESLLTVNRLNITPELLERNKFDIINKNEDALTKGYYVYGFYNEKYISRKLAHKRWDKKHDYVIYGFDRNSRSFYSAGYINQTYQKFTISYDDYYNSLINCTDDFYEIEYIDVCRDYIATVDIGYIKKVLTCYLESKAHFIEIPFRNSVHGISTWYDLAQSMLDNDKFDLRSYRIFKEHKILMYIRLKTFEKLGMIGITNFSWQYLINVLRPAEVIFNLCIKYMYTQKFDLLLRISNLLKIICENEKQIISVFLNTLEQV